MEWESEATKGKSGLPENCKRKIKEEVDLKEQEIGKRK